MSLMQPPNKFKTNLQNSRINRPLLFNTDPMHSTKPESYWPALRHRFATHLLQVEQQVDLTR
jgi:hypothetical protein